jgi:Sulphur transport
MEVVMASLAFLVAAACAGVMGYAIQRGATCTVAAVDEVLSRGSANRLTSLLEASLWVAGGLLVAQALGMLPAMPAGHALSGWTVAGGTLLGLGAWVNRACVFGAIARFGSGEWTYAVTPLGYYVGCLTVGAVFAPPAHAPLPQGSPVLQAPAWAAVAFLVYAAGRIAWPLRREGWRGLAARVWAPHAATIVIGIAFVAMLLLVGGSWAYTDVLAELARGMAGSLPARIVLLLALLLGAVAGGWTAGRLRSTRVVPVQLLRCFSGGVLMAWGSLLIPGSNDGLILVGMPLLWPYAWVAFGTMCVVIALAQRLGSQRDAPATATP